MTDPVLPSFDRPPVVEVISAVSFQPLRNNALVPFALFWKANLAESFPIVEEKPPHIPPVERFGDAAIVPQLSVSLERDMPPPRFWFRNESGDELLQLQRDWFACNWRKVGPGATYSRWPSRREAFSGWFTKLDTYLTEEGLGPLIPRQCEVTYINHIQAGPTWNKHGDLHRLLRTFNPVQTETWLKLESTRAAQQLLILDEETSKPIGRLHISVQPAFSSASKDPVYVLELTARGAPFEQSLDGVIAFLDRGREAIVRSFTAIASDEARAEWGINESN
jgi:uncharacterized protein (TIGR04255 family)